MPRSLRRGVVAPALAMLACIALPALAEAQGDTLRSGMRVRVVAPSVSSMPLEGTLLTRTPDSLVLATEASRPLRLDLGSISQLAVSRGRNTAAGARKGAKWGAALGFAMPFMICDGASCRISTAQRFLFATAVAAEYAIIGAFIGRRRAPEDWVTVPVRPGPPASSGEYLYAWAGDSARASSDFLAVIDASPSSPTYGAVIASVPTGVSGTHPHHTEPELGESGHLLANGFGAGRTWLYDLSQPRSPRIITSFGDVAGFSHPHSFARLANGHVLATFQYAADSTAAHGVDHGATHSFVKRAPGGLVEMDERGTPVRSGAASDPAIGYKGIYPYSALPIPALDRVVTTTTNMDGADTLSTSEWVQFWRLSDLTLRRSIALPPGPRGDENRYTGEPRLLPDGRSVYIHTFNCGLYLVRGADSDSPTSKFVKGFEGKDCGVPVLAGRWWVQTVPATHSLVTLDVSDAEHPREVSTLKIADDEDVHWLAIDHTGRRLVLNSAGGRGNRLYIVSLDPATGALALDERFRDTGASRPGVSFTQRKWPHGVTSTAYPHGTVFSRP